MQAPGRGPAGPPVFERIAIVGLGRLGGSIALAARKAWPSAIVIGVDANPVLEAAVRKHAIDVGADDLVVAADADLIVLAGSPADDLRTLSELPSSLLHDVVVTDLGRDKQQIVAAARRLPPHVAFTGGHPLMTGVEGTVDLPRGDLFLGRVWILTPEREDVPGAERLASFAKSLGGRPLKMTAEENDRLVDLLDLLPVSGRAALLHLFEAAAGGALPGPAAREAESGLASEGRNQKRHSPGSTDELLAALDGLIDRLRGLSLDVGSPRVTIRLVRAAEEWREALARAAGGAR